MHGGLGLLGAGLDHSAFESAVGGGDPIDQVCVEKEEEIERAGGDLGFCDPVAVEKSVCVEDPADQAEPFHLDRQDEEDQEFEIGV